MNLSLSLLRYLKQQKDKYQLFDNSTGDIMHTFLVPCDCATKYSFCRKGTRCDHLFCTKRQAVPFQPHCCSVLRALRFPLPSHKNPPMLQPAKKEKKSL